MNEINYEMKLKLTMTHESWAMNILYAVFVIEKPVWKKWFQENSSKNTSVEKKWIIWKDLRLSESATGGILLKKVFLKLSPALQESTYIEVCFA